MKRKNIKSHLTGHKGRPHCPRRDVAKKKFPVIPLPPIHRLSYALQDHAQKTLPAMFEATSRVHFDADIFCKLLTLSIVSSRWEAFNLVADFAEFRLPSFRTSPGERSSSGSTARPFFPVRRPSDETFQSCMPAYSMRPCPLSRLPNPSAACRLMFGQQQAAPSRSLARTSLGLTRHG